jgi:hypothetical protein
MFAPNFSRQNFRAKMFAPKFSRQNVRAKMFAPKCSRQNFSRQNFRAKIFAPKFEKMKKIEEIRFSSNEWGNVDCCLSVGGNSVFNGVCKLWPQKVLKLWAQEPML